MFYIDRIYKLTVLFSIEKYLYCILLFTEKEMVERV